MENPNIWVAAKVGNISEVKTFLKTTKINEKDSFGNTPLYYASLCGHFHLVKFLLSEGAQDDGLGRAYWNALNLNIRHLLAGKETEAPSETNEKEDGEYTFKSLLPLGKTNKEGTPMSSGISEYKYDISILSGERFGTQKRFNCHLCILIPRWNYLYQKYFKEVEYNEDAIEKQIKDILEIGEITIELSPFTLEAILRHLYTNEIYFVKKSNDISEEQVKDLYETCLKHELFNFAKGITKYYNFKYPTQTEPISMKKSFDFGYITSETKLKPTLYLKEEIIEEVKTSKEIKNLKKAQQQEKLKEMLQKSKDEEKKKIIMKCLADINVKSTDSKTKLLAHKPILVARSSYFNILLGGFFSEIGDDLDSELTENAMLQMIRFLYTNSVQLNKENAVELLVASNKFNMEFLKRKCERFVSSEITNENLLSLIQIGYLSDSEYLQKLCMKYSASEEYLSTEKNLTLYYRDKKYKIQKYYFACYSKYFIDLFLQNEDLDGYEFDDKILSNEEFEFFLNSFSGKQKIPVDNSKVPLLLNLRVFCEKYKFPVLLKKVEDSLTFNSRTHDDLIKKLFILYEKVPSDKVLFQDVLSSTIKTQDDKKDFTNYINKTKMFPFFKDVKSKYPFLEHVFGELNKI